MSGIDTPWWASLNHGGLLIAPAQVAEFFSEPLDPLPPSTAPALRRHVQMMAAGTGELGAFLDTVLEGLLGLERGSWQKANDVDSSWSRKALTGETLKPRRVWQGPRGEALPVFVPDGTRGEVPRLGVGRGRRAVARVVEWLRLTGREIALLTNGRQLRLIHAGADYDAFCEWDIDQWFEEGALGPQVDALRHLLGRKALTIRDTGHERPPLVRAILASRKGQGELSAVLGERVRQAVETLIQTSSPMLDGLVGGEKHQIAPKDTYIAATRMIMRLVVILFAEARELLPTGNPIYHGAYGLSGLREELERSAGGRAERLRHRFAAWPRLLGLFQLVYEGSGHEDLIITHYGGGLFRPGRDGSDGISRALQVFEDPRNHISDDVVHRLIDLLTRSKVRVRQGRSSVWIDAPVDFSNLSTEYIGILYEGLLDYELRRADKADPMVFLDVGNQPVLPFSRLDAMTVKDRKSLLEKLAKKNKSDEGQDEAEEEAEDDEQDASEPSEADAAAELLDDETRLWHEKVETWARNAVRDVGWVKRGADFDDPEVVAKAKQLVRRVVLPGEWFLVRWGGTRKGAGSFYTPPQLAGPTVRRTLQPLTHAATGADEWRPKLPEEILALKVCDPAMGSGSFLVSALHWLTDALYQSLVVHNRIARRADGGIARLADGVPDDSPWVESLPLPPEHEEFESKLRARLKRHVVERCIYGVDIDPVAVELARLALWVDTMDERLPFEFLDHKLRCGNALVGCWYDRFQSYPITAWEREGGDKSHTNFVHHYREVRSKDKKKTERKGDAWTQAIKDKKAEIKEALVSLIQERKQPAFASMRNDAATPNELLVEARGTFEAIHQERDPERQAEVYAKLQVDLARLREAFDSWCALWFWPGDALDDAPTPQNLTAPADAARRQSIERLRGQYRFFHWELEFSDVFTGPGAGFDAIVGNPPWDIQKPNSKEFFSNVEPLYRSLGKQEALRWQKQAFEDSPELEREWIAYQARFKGLSNWVGWVAEPFGDPEQDPEGKGYSLARKDSAGLHRVWREIRGREQGYADAEHPFRHQGSADLNSYKLFLELGHALLARHGRFGLIVPSGLYTDKGTSSLRELLLDKCNWEWLFGFENREEIFEIDGRFKFAAVIVEKGGKTAEISAAFMRRELADWDGAQPQTLTYPRARIGQFSPKSKAILELSAERDLAVLEKLYANGVLLGDSGPDGWGIEYSTEFHMTNDSKLFAPRPKWESKGYLPDEYGHWLAGGWRPYSGPKSVLKRKLGLVLSRDGRQAIRVGDIEDVALPLYEGRMVGQFDFSEKGWVSGKGRTAEWREIPLGDKVFEPQYLMSSAQAEAVISDPKIAFMAIGSASNRRSMICSFVDALPTGHSLSILRSRSNSRHGELVRTLALTAILNSYVNDAMLRYRLGGLNISSFILAEVTLPMLSPSGHSFEIHTARLAAALNLTSEHFARTALQGRQSGLGESQWRRGWATTHFEVLRIRSMLDAVIAHWFGLDREDLRFLLRECDWPQPPSEADSKGFWRIDQEHPPELRHTVLAQVAFQDLQRLGLERFLSQNDGEGWMLPETLRLADYGLGHDDRAKQHQPVAAALGPRFYDWQLAQSVEESWEECERHAELIDQILPLPKPSSPDSPSVTAPSTDEAQGSLFGEDIVPTKKKRSKKK